MYGLIWVVDLVEDEGDIDEDNAEDEDDEDIDEDNAEDEDDEDEDEDGPYRKYSPVPSKESAIAPNTTCLAVYRFLAAFKSLKIFWVSGLRVVSVFSLAI